MSDNLFNKNSKWLNPKTFFLLVLILGNGLLLTPEGSVFRVAGAMILLLLPGLTWAESLTLSQDRLVRWVVGLGLSYVFIVIFGLLLHYIPGSTSLWMILLVPNTLVLSALIKQQFGPATSTSPSSFSTRLSGIHLLLLAILLCGAFFRFRGLEYTEFQGDELKPMVSAANSLEGREDALFIRRKKGPGEILIPVMQWRLTGTTNELAARLPFALAGTLAILTVYLIAGKLLGKRVGLMAAGLMALNGFMVGFSRILQYQQMVIWMSLLSLLGAWEWRETKQTRWAVLVGMFLGVGLLFHYDTVLIIPALAYLLVSKPKFVLKNLKSLALTVFILGAIVALFILPFTTNPQATFTTNYVGGRIGQILSKNNLFDFFHYTIFYDSLYYVVITGLLILGFLTWAFANTHGVRRSPMMRYILPAITVIAIICLSVYPKGFYLSGLDIDLGFLPFVLILLGAFLSPSVNLGQKIIIVWLAVSFLGYNFAVADPRTHFYTVSPAWIMLAAPAAIWLWRKLASTDYYLPIVFSSFLTVLFGGYLYIAFLRQDVEFRTEWPDSQPALYWSPYTTKPRHHFGFVHKVGWKAIGGLYANGQLEGRLDTNSGSGLRRWYSRQAGWGCSCCQPQKYYLAFDYKEINYNALTNYGAIGQIRLPTNGKGVTIYQSEPVTEEIESLAVDELYQAFDNTATPAAFVWPRGEKLATDVNFADLFHLLGYEIILPQPQPGEELAVVLHWQRGKDYQPINFNVLVQLMDANGHIWGQSDTPPVCGQQQTSTWSAGKTVVDAHLLLIDPNTPPGEYVIIAGMYLPDENFHLPILDDAGQPTVESATLGTVIIE